MTALVRMRVAAYLRAQFAVAPTVAGLVVLAALYGGGVARPEEAYGVSAAVMFPVLAWQAKIFFDAEPDVARRLARLAVGGAGPEIRSGLLGAALTAIPTIAAAMILPWLFGGVGTGLPSNEGPAAPLGLALVVGLWAHLIAVPPAVAVGAWASRPISTDTGRAAAILVGGTVLAIVLGLFSSPVPWLAPPLMAVARFTTSTGDPSSGATLTTSLLLTGWAVAWAAALIAGYWRLRLRRA
jgi:hypothetical protein